MLDTGSLLWGIWSIGAILAFVGLQYARHQYPNEWAKTMYSDPAIRKGIELVGEDVLIFFASMLFYLWGFIIMYNFFENKE